MTAGRSALIAILAAVVLAAFGSGCATIVCNSQQDVRIRVNPGDATVRVDGQAVQANSVVPLTRADVHYVDVAKEGFASKRVTVRSGLNGWFFGNLVWGPGLWIGMLVDALNGRINDLVEEVSVTLDPLSPGAVAVAPASVATQPDPFRPAGPNPTLDDQTARPAGPALGEGPKQLPPIPKTKTQGAQREWVIAVMNASQSANAGFESSMLIALTDQIRVYLAERSARVVDRSTQDSAIKSIVDDEKKKSYGACVDSSCQIPLGKALAATHIVRSSIARFGKQCATNGELIDLKAEVTVAAGSARGECTEEALLYAAESLAEQLVAGSAPR